MSAEPFDAQAIAARVAARQSSPRPPVQPRTPLSRVEGSCATGGDDNAHGLAVPTTPPADDRDIFTRLEEGRTRHAIRSPIVLRDAPKPETAAEAVQREAHDKRYVAPRPQTPAPEPSSSTNAEAVKRVGGRADQPTVRVQVPCTTPHCGEPLTGRGAPRGWVLVRIIGGGMPRRYCCGWCASKAVLTVTSKHKAVAPARITRRRSTLDIAEITRRYNDGQTPPQIGAALGHTAGTVRRALDRVGVQRHDARTTHSGSHRKDYDPEIVERVRSLYTLHGLTQHQVAEQLGCTPKVVHRLMQRHGIQARPPANIAGHPHPTADRAAPLKQLMAAHGITAKQVRAWARQQGRDVPTYGLLSRQLVDAYLNTHPTHQGDPQ